MLVNYFLGIIYFELQNYKKSKFHYESSLKFNPNSKDILINPKGLLSELCEKIQIPFYEKMLFWPKGRRESDGIWAEHWYKNVENSTGFNC